MSDKKAELRNKVTGAVGDLQTKATQAPPVQQAKQRPWIPAAAGIGAGLVLLVVRRRRS